MISWYILTVRMRIWAILRVVLLVLKEHQLFAKYSKCEFWLRFVDFLGHIVSSEGIDVNKMKTKVAMNWRRPLTPTYIQSIFGLAGYYRRFVHGFPSVASPMTTLTQKKIKFKWLYACERSFQELKDKLTSTQVLFLPEGTKGLVVYANIMADALSRITMGSVSHVEDSKKKLVKDVHRLARLGVRFEYSPKGGFIIHHNSK